MKWRYDSKILCKANPAYRVRLDEWLRERWPPSAENWDGFLRQLPGFYPLDVWQALEQSGRSINALALNSNSVARHIFPEPFPGVLEHPLDYEWRFTQESIQSVMDVLDAEVKAGCRASVVCLGCPSIVVAGALTRPSWRWTLLDKRAHLLRATSSSATLVRCDLTQGLPTLEEQDVAVVDPPWYMPITKHFLARAYALLKPGGVVLLSFPPEGTRPNAKIELENLIEWCEQGGLTLTKFDAPHLFYRTPFFEWNSLRSAGFSARVPAWRRADLLMFRKMNVGEQELRYNEEVPQQFCGTWKDFVVDGLKICVNTTGVTNNTTLGFDEEIRPVWTEDVLPTVSTSFPGRAKANVVTSGNRFFVCSRPDLAVEALQALSAGSYATLADEKCGLYAKTLKAAIRSETAERHRYLNYMYD